MAIYFREDCRTLDDSLQLEMVTAQYCLQIREVRTTAGVPVGDALGADVVAELEREGDPLSHAILRGVAHLGVGEMAKRSADAVVRLTERDPHLPRQFADVGKARAVGAWRMGDLDGEQALFAEFEHPRGRRHTMALYVDPRHGGVVNHIGLVGPMSELEPSEPFHPEALSQVEISGAGALMSEVLERSYGPGATRTDDFRVLIAAARAGSMVPGGPKSVAPASSGGGRRRAQ